MLYATLKIGEQEFKGRLSAKRCVELERALGKNPLRVFTELEGNNLPSITELLTILHYALVELNHDFDEYAIYDAYCDEGGDISGLIQYLLEVFRVSGFIPRETNNKRKN